MIYICSKTIYKQIRFKQTLSFETKRMNKLSKYCNVNKEEYILLLQLMGRQQICIVLADQRQKAFVNHIPNLSNR
jgi:hypothetical protein